MDYKQRQAQQHQEDVALTRALLWIGAAIVLEGLLVFLNRFYINFYPQEIDLALFLQGALKLVRIGGLTVAGLCILWAAVLAFKNSKPTLPLILTIAGGALSICSHVILKFKDTGMSMLFWLVIAWAVLAVVYYIYQKEFFVSAASVGLSILGMWFVRYSNGFSYEVAIILAAVVIAMGVTVWIKKNDGAIALGTPAPFFSEDCSYSVVLVSCVAALAVLIASMVLGASIAYYLIFAMMAWIFGLFVYYTVKLM